MEACKDYKLQTCSEALGLNGNKGPGNIPPNQQEYHCRKPRQAAHSFAHMSNLGMTFFRTRAPARSVLVLQETKTNEPHDSEKTYLDKGYAVLATPIFFWWIY